MIVAASAGSLTVAVLALLLAALHALVYVRGNRVAWFGWGVWLGLATSAYALAVFFNYNTDEGFANQLAERVQYTSVSLVVLVLYGFSLAFFALPSRGALRLLTGGTLVWVVLIWSTDLIIGPGFVQRSLSWLPKSYVEPRQGPLGPAILVYFGLTMAWLLVLWLRNRRKNISGFNYFIAGFLVWAVLATHDILVTLGMPSVTFLLEYGYLATGLGLLFVLADHYRQINRSLLKAQRMEALATLASGVAHDFNNLLQGISAAVELMQINPDQGGVRREYYELVEREVLRGGRLVRQLLSLRRGEPARVAPLDLNHEVSQTVEILGSTIPKMIRIRTRLDPDLWPVMGDASLLEQVLLNLGLNARDAMPQGGELSLTTENIYLSQSQAQGHGLARAGNYVLLEVIDNGHGMDQETLGRVFEPFFSTKDPSLGTGLGLATSRASIEAHGGVITCQSQPGRGSRFRIILPASDQPLPTTTLVKSDPSLLQGQGELILVVEDEDGLRLTVCESLEMAGYRTLAAANGEQALEIFAQHRDAIRLVMLDLNMPGMGGRALLSSLLALSPEVRAIISTGYLPGQEGDQDWPSQVRYRLSKPYQRDQMLAALRRTLDS